MSIFRKVFIKKVYKINGLVRYECQVGFIVGGDSKKRKTRNNRDEINKFDK